MKKETEFLGTQFSEVEDLYTLDKKTGLLLKTGTVNCQKRIQSAAVNTYDQMIAARQAAEVAGVDRFGVSEEVEDHTFTGDLLDFEDYCDELREKYNLGDAKASEIVDFLKSNAMKEQKQEEPQDEEKKTEQEGVEA